MRQIATMLTALIATSLISFTSAKGRGNLLSWNQAANLVDITDILKIDGAVDFDMSWGTGYDSGPYKKTGVVAASKFNFEKYWLKVGSLGSANLVIEFFNAYKISLTLNGDLFEVHPVEATVLFYRPEQGSL